jgi:hypothetical protein
MMGGCSVVGEEDDEEELAVEDTSFVMEHDWDG